MEKGGTRVEQSLLHAMEQFIADLQKKEAAAVYTIRDDAMNAIKKAKNLDTFLHDMINLVQGSGGIDLTSIIRREFGISKDIMQHFDRLARHSKEQFEEALHDAIDRAEIRAGKQGMFFAASPDKQERADALRLLKDIAHAAVKIQFHRKSEGAETYVELLDKLIRFYELPHTYPAGDAVNYKKLIASDRLNAMSGNNETISLRLREFAKAWYQQSAFTFLESRDTYPVYEDVRNYLYALNEDQLNRLRTDFIRQIRLDFEAVQAAKDLHRAEALKKQLEAVMSWE
ncbi:hypothetical protein J2X61_001732 [Bacillus sp. 3255]|nr:hypothetical protein [Bacillus sp. 3255]